MAKEQQVKELAKEAAKVDKDRCVASFRLQLSGGLDAEGDAVALSG